MKNFKIAFTFLVLIVLFSCSIQPDNIVIDKYPEPAHYEKAQQYNYYCNCYRDEWEFVDDRFFVVTNNQVEIETIQVSMKLYAAVQIGDVLN